MNWYILIPIGIAVVALLIFLIRQNQKDKKELVDKLNQDYRKSKFEEDDIDPEEMPH